jgi:hypothetical protein
MRLAAYLSGIGVLGPGLADWPHTQDVLSGRVAYSPVPTILPTPAQLPAAERRRTGRVVKLAIAVAQEATTSARVDPATLASVFSSSGGDGHNCHELCTALARQPREVSPTRFANSVHNAAAGYWSIATGAQLESNVLCAFDSSFGAGLLEAMVQVAVDEESLLLVAYDTEYPEPINSVRPLPDAFGVALVLTPHRQRSSIAQMELSLGQDSADTLADPQLEGMRTSIPAARCLPLLLQLARREAGAVVLDYLDVSRLVLNVAPCA